MAQSLPGIARYPAPSRIPENCRVCSRTMTRTLFTICRPCADRLRIIEDVQWVGALAHEDAILTGSYQALCLDR